MKNNRAKKILSFVLAASMVFAAMAPTMSFAARDAVVKNNAVTQSTVTSKLEEAKEAAKKVVAKTEAELKEAEKDFEDEKAKPGYDEEAQMEAAYLVDSLEKELQEAKEAATKAEKSLKAIEDEINGVNEKEDEKTEEADAEAQNLTKFVVRLNNKDLKGSGSMELAFTTEAEEFEGKNEFTQTVNIKDGKATLNLNELFKDAKKEDLNGAKFTMTVNKITFKVGDESQTVLNPEEIEVEDIQFKYEDQVKGVENETIENPMNLDFYTAIEKLTLKVLENGLEVEEDADKYKATIEVNYEDKDDKPTHKENTFDLEIGKKGKSEVAFSNFGTDLLEKSNLIGDAKYTLTVKNDEGKKVEVTFETNAFGRITKVNGNDAVYNDKDDELKDIKVEFDKKYTDTTRFEIEKYDDEKGFAIEKIEILPLIRKDQKSAYRRDNDGNYMIEEKATSIKVDGKDLLDAKLDGTKFDINKKELKTALDNAKKDTAINLGKTGEQNIVALRFTEELRKNHIDTDGNQQRYKDIFINVDDLKDKDIIKLVNPLANFELEVLVKGGNPSKAIEGATVEILPAELDTLGVAQYGKAIATGTTKANGKVKFEGINLETIIKHAALNRKDSNFVNENAVKETVLPFQIVVKDAKGFETKEYVLTQKDIVEEKATIDLNTAKTVEDIRIAGANRYETALKVAMDLKADGSRNVVIASGKNYADALVGARYANYQNAVLLLVENEIDKNVMEYLDMATKQVTLLGGNASVAPGVQEELAKKFDVNRIYGKDRYETSVNVAKAMKEVENVFVASGENYADALVASAAANRLGNTAILLTEKAEMPSVVKTYLDATADNYKKAFVFGGEGSVSERVMAQVNEAVTAERVKGADRDETAVAVANKFFAEDAKAVVASGANYADALVAGTMNQPVILVTGGVNDAVKNYLNDQIMNAKVIGGAGSVSDAIVDEVVKNLK